MTPVERARLQAAIADHCEAAKGCVRDGHHYKATIILRAPHLPDGDVVVTEDSWPEIAAALKRASGRAD